jgi:hypothetical protein
MDRKKQETTLKIIRNFNEECTKMDNYDACLIDDWMDQFGI